MNVVEVKNVKVEKSLIVSTAFIEFTDNELTDKTLILTDDILSIFC